MPSNNFGHEWSNKMNDSDQGEEFPESEVGVDYMASFFPMPEAAGDPQSVVSPSTPTIDIDIDPLNPELSSSSAENSTSDPGGSVASLSPVSTLIMSALDLNTNSSSHNQNLNLNVSSGTQTQEAIAQSIYSLYNANSRQSQKSTVNSTANQTMQGLGGLGGGPSLNPQLLNMNIDSLHASLNNGGGSGAGEAGTPGGNVSQQVMLEQFRLAQLQQLQHLQAQIFQQQLAIINSGAMLGLQSGSEGSSSTAQPSNQNRPSNLFHGLPTPGSSTELRASAPAVEFVSPMLLNYANHDMNDMTNNQHHQNHSPYGTSTSSSRHSHSHSHSNPHSLTQTPVFSAQAEDDPNSMALDSLAPLNSRFSRNSSNDNENSSVYHRGTSSAPAHIAFSRPQPQHDNDFDISPLTSPWLGAEGGAGNTRSRVHTYNHRPVHHGQPHQQQSQMDWSQPNTKRAASPTMEEHARKTRQSPAIRAAVPESIPSSVGPVRKNSRSSRSVNSTPLLKGTTGAGITGGRSRKDSVAASKTSPPNAGSSSSSSGTNMVGNSSGYGEMVQDSPSPVDLSLSMPPPATGSASNQNTTTTSSSSASNSTSNTTTFSVSLDNMNLGFDVGGFNFGGSLGTPTSPNRGYPAPGSMAPLLMPVTPASIMNLGRAMNNPPTGSNSGGTGNGLFRGFRSDDGTGMGRGTGVEDLDMSILPPPSATPTSATSSIPPPPSPSIDTPATTASGPPLTATGRKGKAKATKDTTGAGANGEGGPTRSKSGRKGTVGPGQNLKAILPAASNSAASSPILPSSSSNSNPNNSTSSPSTFPVTAVRKTSHKAAEQKRRDSLKTTFDDLRGLLPPIPLSSDAADDLAGGGFVAGVVAAARASMLPGALPPRGPPKAGAEGPNKGVSKLQLLICGNEYIRVLRARVERRDEEIERLRREIRRLRLGGGMDGDDDGEDMEEEPVDLEKDLDAVEWANVRAHSAAMTESIPEEGEGEDG
ncbi:hypothetical protein L218DRAFT_960356 [Marasmius fiardii PR-910]|nr:hypothetical protein L218DRAFT_960356 [Marasmius fiardii PR-910]